MADAIDITLSDVETARRRIAGSVAVSPCAESEALSQLTSMRIVCKLDNLQRTGSFKERGARNALASLSPVHARHGVIAASAGNHALALACHGCKLGVPITVVMPRFATLAKVSRCRAYGARVILHGETFADARAHADDVASSEQLTYIHGFDDPSIIAGQGTIGLELIDQVTDLDAVIVPVGGGGLIAGVSLAIKSMRPQTKVIGVEPARAAAWSAARQAGKPVRIQCQPTLADGLAVGCIGSLAFAAASPRVDHVVTVDEARLAQAVVRLMELEKFVVEGAAAAPLAAILSGELEYLRGKRVALLLSGGNIDLSVLDRIIAHGLVADGRLRRFSVVISDRPGGLAQLTRLIAEAGASVQGISHDRAFAGPDVSTVRVSCVIETMDRRHAQQVLRQLANAGYLITQPRNQE